MTPTTLDKDTMITTCYKLSSIAELLGLDARPFTFKYVELKRATNDFSPANKLGEGGFGAVYKVTLYSIYSM